MLFGLRAQYPCNSPMLEFIDLKSQYRSLQKLIRERMDAVLERGQYILGPEVTELEEKLAAYAGVKHCIACSSGTDALLLALMALGIGPGDEVITSPFSFIATGEMIALLRATPVFVDIRQDTFNLDAELLEQAITKRTRALIPVSLYGQCADMDEINGIATRFGIPVIEDAAQSFGATYKGRKSCALSPIACTSFYPAKPLGCYGDGGACFADDDTLAGKIRQISLHGEDGRYHHVSLGLNGRLDTLQAAILLAKLTVFASELDARQHIAALYNEILRSAVQTPYIEPFNTSSFAQYTIQVDRRDVLRQRLQQDGIPTAVHYPVPIHLQPAFEHLGKPAGSFPVSEAAARRVLSLPMHPYLEKSHLEGIADSIKKAIEVFV